MPVKLQISQLRKSFGEGNQNQVLALDRVSMSVGKNEFVGLIGPSGSGKSSLLDILAGLSLPDTGEILMDGKSLLGRKGEVSYMPQSDVLFPWRTILDNVTIPMEVAGIPRKEARKEAMGLLPTFGLESFAESYPKMLSGGMRQRASFLRTFLCKKDMMLLDEPFGKLDALTRMQMQEWLLDMWQKFQHAVLFVTHDVEEAILLCDRIYVLSARPGRVLGEVEVNLPRPRTSVMSTNSDFIRLKRNLLEMLKEGTGH
ncbi:ABC transporter ATP-binding protein [Ammoniphilus resinae]|uniref:ABC-type nitrate/sulfonate/bicarbonate transport system ATPase subunit n=1 Tax=Ammoniphilus resinae TaxID=861532 RepID=A0ABS4GN08_9BACL|nr:ABC transporter ATP-binding protein [Ammoniphilus resinae]MBP1931668.1 ABC-type nitrate/sulfonate/bicarbonate transport system ATPase subunit [Ammoniphilus resinae]